MKEKKTKRQKKCRQKNATKKYKKIRKIEQA